MKVLLVGAFALGFAGCGKAPCDDLVQQLQACPHYQQVVDPSALPLDCEGAPVNDIAQCILDSGQDVCSPDGLAKANAACKK
jgi:hypothetical protein